MDAYSYGVPTRPDDPDSSSLSITQGFDSRVQTSQVGVARELITEPILTFPFGLSMARPTGDEDLRLGFGCA